MSPPRKADTGTLGERRRPYLTKAVLEQQRAERTQYWEEVNKIEGERNIKGHIACDISTGLTEEDISRRSFLADSTRSLGSIYGGLKAAKKRKRTDETDNSNRSHKPSNASFVSPPPDVKDRTAPNPYAPVRQGPRKSSAAYEKREPVNTRMAASISQWYQNIDMKETMSRSDIINLSNLNDAIKRYVTAVKAGTDKARDKIAQELRDKVHDIEFFMPLQNSNGALIKKSRVLESQGLPAIFDNEEGIDFPYDIKDDARALYSRWIVGKFDPHLLRGIDTEKGTLANGKRRTGHKMDQSYERKSANVIGDNGIVNGQWWPTRMCLLRDGAHGAVEAGISGQAGKGAFSIVMAKGGYDDKDDGEVIQYCGTAGENYKPTANTTLMLEANKFGNPLKVMRSESSSEYAPQKGIRYDGLYIINGYTVLDSPTAMHRFRLERCPGQDPIRYKGVAARPTPRELDEYSKIKYMLSKIP